MNLDAADKKYAKKFLTAFLSLQGIVALFMMSMFVLFGIFFVKEWNKANARFDRGVAAFHESKKEFLGDFDKKFEEAREGMIRPSNSASNRKT